MAADAAEKISAHIFKVDGSKNPVADVVVGNKVCHMKFHPTVPMKFACTGKDHLLIGEYDGKKSIKKNQSKEGSHCSAAWIHDSKFPNDLITGGADGKLYHWTGHKKGKGVTNNKGPVQSCACRPHETMGELVLAGGNDKTLTVYKFTGSLEKLWNIATDAAPRSVDLFKGQILIGMKNGSIAEMEMTEKATAKPNVVMTSHCDGEAWGIDVVDFEDGSMRLLTVADDNRVLAYDPKERKVLAEG